MAASVLICEDEFKALSGKDEFLFKLYISCIRRHMDYSTGIVGGRLRRICYPSIDKEMYIDNTSGVRRELTGAPTKSKVQRALKQLEKIGLLERIPDKDHLIFKCLLARQDKSVQKQADTRPIPLSDTEADTIRNGKKPRIARVSNDRIIQADTEADTHKSAQADTPPVSGKDKDINNNKSKSYPQRRKQFPKDFEVKEDHLRLSEKNGWPNPHDEIEAFRDFHMAKGSLFIDWDRAFYTWLRNAKRFKEKSNAKYQNNPTIQKRTSSVTQVFANILEEHERGREATYQQYHELP